MKAAVITFPGSNCNRDLQQAFKLAGFEVVDAWHKDNKLPAGLDVIGIPGGFSFGDALRPGAIAAVSPICNEVKSFADKGGYVLGICNGFQVLTETRLLPGALMRNKHGKFISKNIELHVNNYSPFTNKYQANSLISIPIAHHDGNYYASDDDMDRLVGDGRIPFAYVNNPNGSLANAAGVLSENKRVLGMMPHPERAVESETGGVDGLLFFKSIIEELNNDDT